MAKVKQPTFGEFVRMRRLNPSPGGQAYTVTAFAALIDTTKAYVSSVELDHYPPYAVEKLPLVAKILKVHPDEIFARAGHVPPDVKEIVLRNPVAIAGLLRAVKGMNADQIQETVAAAKQMKRDHRVARATVQGTMEPWLVVSK